MEILIYVFGNEQCSTILQNRSSKRHNGVDFNYSSLYERIRGYRKYASHNILQPSSESLPLKRSVSFI